MLRASNCRNLELSPLCFALRAFTHHLVCCFRLTIACSLLQPHMAKLSYHDLLVVKLFALLPAVVMLSTSPSSRASLLKCCSIAVCNPTVACCVQIRKPLLAGRISLLCTMRGGVSGMGERESGQGPVRANRGDLFSANVCALCEPVKLSHLSLCHF